MKKEQTDAIQAWADAAGITDELSIFEDARPPVDKPGDGIKYILVETFDITDVVMPQGFSLYRKVKVND
jgi:hypothetical protein